jgi:hypothetical protein
MKITKICIFAYPTEGEALAVANNTVGATGIAEITILRPPGSVVPYKGKWPPPSSLFADRPVAWIVLPESVIDALATTKDFNVAQALDAAKKEISQL